MSYCRFGPDSDVYLYASFDGGFDIWLAKKGFYRDNVLIRVETHEECREKLRELSQKGYKIPPCAIERLTREIINGP